MKTAMKLMLLVIAIAMTGCLTTGKKPLDPAQQVELAEQLDKSLVIVEYTLQYDRGQAPQGVGAASYGRYYGGGGGDMTIRQERPLELPGLLLGPTTVMSIDQEVHPRFIKSIRVAYKGKTVDAELEARVIDQGAIRLKLAEPLEGAVPITIDAEAKAPYYCVTYREINAMWSIHTRGFPKMVTVAPGKRESIEFGNCFVVDGDGKLVGAVMTLGMPVDESWKGSPLDWPTISAADYAARIKDFGQTVDASIMRATIYFRSPKNKAGSGGYGGGFGGGGYGGGYDTYGNQGAASATENNTTAVAIDAHTALLLVEIDTETIKRLKSIRVYGPDGKTIDGKFKGVLKDYSLMVVTFEEELPAVAPLSTDDVFDIRNKLLLKADIAVSGRARTAYYQHGRIAQFRKAFKGVIHASGSDHGSQSYYFDLEGNLAVLPVKVREKVSVRRDNNYWGGGYGSSLVPAQKIAEIMTEVDKHIDPSMVPVQEEEEERVAWLGVILQGLDHELAVANNVVEHTRGGQTGALISHVYPNSPAGKAGIEPGMIILRLHAEGEPKPVDISLGYDDYGSYAGFQWEHLDRIPVEYFDSMPPPWPSVANNFSRTLTDLGIGKKFVAEFAKDGELFKKDFVVTQAPHHFHSSPQFKSERLGLTVRDLTVEVRRYMQRKDADPGVLIAKMEAGTKTAVAGMRPYEIITHMNDKPLKSIKDFEELAREGDTFTFSILRMSRARQVTITLSKQDDEPQEPASVDDVMDAMGL